MQKSKRKTWIFYLILIIVLAGGGYLYHMLQSPGLPAGFAQSNGR
ncbi:hemolysin D, partial [Salmonella enterica subsp. enterica serovar Enteritidis]|nr:hemolysin D [Salmonella enterica subsp. enterica serovar Enteritidis]